MLNTSKANGKENIKNIMSNLEVSPASGSESSASPAGAPNEPSERAKRAFVRNIALDLVLTFVTFFLYNIYVNAEQMDALNYMLGEPKYSFWRWFLFCICTFGLYHVYHEYVVARDLMILRGEPQSSEPMIHVVLTCLGFSFVADAIQQYHINHYFGSKGL